MLKIGCDEFFFKDITIYRSKNGKDKILSLRRISHKSNFPKGADIKHIIIINKIK